MWQGTPKESPTSRPTLTIFHLPRFLTVAKVSAKVCLQVSTVTIKTSARTWLSQN